MKRRKNLMSLADGGCRSSAAAEERIFRNCILAGFRSAGSHCENNPILTSESIPHLRLDVSCGEQVYHLLSLKVVPKASARRKPAETHSASLKRAPVAGLQANRPRFLTLVAARFFSALFAMRRLLCASRNNDFDFFLLSFSRSPVCGIALLPLFSLCLIFWCFWIKPKAQEKNL